MNIHSIYAVFMAYFRPARIRVLRGRFPQIDGSGAILDIGGAPGWWKLVEPKNRDITIVNIDQRQEKNTVANGFKFKVVDGRSLPFGPASFDLTFSNSVIEHVGSFEDQRRFASEMLRCGKSIYLQTPNKWFPVEPHMMALLIHWLPFLVQRRLVRWATVWGWVTKPDQAAIDSFVRGIRLMSRNELKEIFPGCEITSEKFLGLTKSFIVTEMSSPQQEQG